jgi:serine/threonine protein kinase
VQTQNRVGQQFGNYQLTKLIGSGGYAEVYLAKHLYLSKQEYAIKILAETNLQEEQRNDFLREAQTVSNLQHLSSHIVEIKDFGIQTSGNAAQDGVPYLVMEYAAEGTMRTLYPHDRRVPLDKIVFYMNQVAEALQCAHDQNPPIIHRDIKPENMLLRTRDHLLLSDFGIAITGQATSHIISVKEKDVVGTVTYMAPERLSKRTRRASDQYSLGIVLYEWLSGAPPFDGTEKELIYKQLVAQPEPLCGKYPHITQEIEDVVFRALEKDPNDRYPNVWEFAQALEEAVQKARNKRSVQQPVVNAQPSPTIQQPVVNVQSNPGVQQAANAQSNPGTQQWSITPQQGQVPSTIPQQPTPSLSPTAPVSRGRTPSEDLPTLPSQRPVTPQPVQQQTQSPPTFVPSQQPSIQSFQPSIVPQPWSPQPLMSATIPNTQLPGQISLPPPVPQPQGQITLPPIPPQTQGQISVPPIMGSQQAASHSQPVAQKAAMPSVLPPLSNYSSPPLPRRGGNFFDFSSQFLWNSNHAFFIFGGLVLNALTAIFLGLSLGNPRLLIVGFIVSLLAFLLCICAVEPLLAGFFGVLVALCWLYVGWILGGYLASSLHINPLFPPVFLALVFFIVSLTLHIRYIARKSRR